MNCSNCSARGNLQNWIARLIVSVPSRKASISRGCAILEDRLYVADVTSTNRRGAGNLLPHINMLSFRQICRTLVFASGAHVVERSLLKIGLQCQRQANADKRIPSAPGLMVGEYEL